eukprot:TRINITY_DN1600_c0_g7_i2.p1 TRINITY_DN1600_c0_g7~~TRINITY_DN1600_c0_g7_i2.p1  ORF type:complete len:395 (+),score=115.00 TRINITY_DN1600_c0_g7_i2:1-1185(+)
MCIRDRVSTQSTGHLLLFFLFISNRLLSHRWIKSVIAKETWESTSKSGSETNDRCTSKSPGELCSKLRQTFKFLKTLKMKTDQDILLFAKVLCDITQYYTGSTATIALESDSIHKKVVIANNISAISRNLEQLSFDVESDYEIGSDYFHLWLADAFPFFEQKIDEVLFSCANATTTPLQHGLGGTDNSPLPSQELISLITNNVNIFKTELTPILRVQLFTFLWKGIGDAVEDYVCNQSNNIRLVTKQTAKIEHVLQHLRNVFLDLLPKKDLKSIENKNVDALLQLLQATSETEVDGLEGRLTLENLGDEKLGKYKQLLSNLKQFVSSSSSSPQTTSPAVSRKEETTTSPTTTQSTNAAEAESTESSPTAHSSEEIESEQEEEQEQEQEEAKEDQ